MYTKYGKDKTNGTRWYNFAQFHVSNGATVSSEKKQLRVFNEDILTKVSPIPFSSRYTGLSRKDLKITEKLFLV